VISCVLGSIFTLSVLSNTRKFKTSTLHENERLVSKNGKYFAELKTDGNFVLYLTKEEHGKEVELQVWETKTHGKGKGPYKLVMQQDGNAILFDNHNTHIWATNTAGKGKKPYRLVLQDDGNLVIYSHEGTSTWATKTAEPKQHELKTTFHEDESGSIHSLEKHAISCPEHSAVHSFRLEKDHHKIRYVFKCVTSEQHITNDCHEEETHHNDIDKNEKHSVDYLDRHKIKCEDGKVLRSFGLHSKDHKIFYKYSCCKANVKNCNKTGMKDVPKGDKSLAALDKLEVEAFGNGLGVFEGIHMTAVGKNYSYKNKVCEINYIH